MLTARIWPALDYSRVPYRLYHDAEIYAREQERIFRGPVWCFLGLDCEIPNPGDFRATYVGDTPVVFNRDKSGAVKAFVNRCAHRGALVRREISGNADQHICIYHQWCYGLDGGLTGDPVPPRHPGQGRARPELRHAGARAAAVARRPGQRRAVRHLGRGCRAARRLSRRADPGAAAPPARPAGAGARLQPPAHPRQLEALRREHPRQLPRQPVARVSRHLRARPVDPGRRGQDGRPPPPQHHLGGGGQRHRRVSRTRLMPAPGCATISCR